MSEEEKKAIEKFKRKIERADKDIVKFSDVYTTLDIHNLRLLLNLIQKQQKEIEKLEKNRKVSQYFAKTVAEEYIHKDKIREKIKEIENSGLQENIKACVCNKLAQLL